MTGLPLYIYWIFGLTTLFSLFLFYKATGYSKTFAILSIAWIAAQIMIGISGFYLVEDTMPPRLALLILPPLVSITGLFLTEKGRQFIDRLDVKMLTLFHIIRIPVELVLFWLFVNKTIPQLMTFEGRNFDILSGLSAPVVYYFGFVKKKLSRNGMLVWNFICLGLLLNIVTHAVLSAPTIFQKFAFDQPNVAVLYFPFILLPACLVPLVLLSHLASVRWLLTAKISKRNRPGYQS